MDTRGKGPSADYGAWLSIGVYIALACLKLAVGYFAHSKALMADGWNNSTDIIASLAVLIGLKIARKPADSDHRYGHSRAETVASMVASLIMVAVGLDVGISAVTQWVQGDLHAPNLVAAVMAGVGALVMLFVYRYNLRLARATGSHALKAVAADNRSDALVSLGTVVGIGMSVLGLPLLDSITALIVGLMICKTGWDIFREASHMLTDGFNLQDLEVYKATVAGLEGVEQVTDIKGRSHGNQVFLDLTIAVDQDMSVLDSHAISDTIENELMAKHQVQHVHVHIEPH